MRVNPRKRSQCDVNRHCIAFHRRERGGGKDARPRRRQELSKGERENQRKRECINLCTYSFGGKFLMTLRKRNRGG